MTQQTKSMQRGAASLACLLTLGSIGVMAAPTAALAQHAHKNIFQRHPVLTGAAAGIAAHHYAKKTGKARTASGQHRNFAQRHPTLTGAAAAIGAHKLAKRH